VFAFANKKMKEFIIEKELLKSNNSNKNNNRKFKWKIINMKKIKLFALLQLIVELCKSLDKI